MLLVVYSIKNNNLTKDVMMNKYFKQLVVISVVLLGAQITFAASKRVVNTYRTYTELIEVHTEMSREEIIEDVEAFIDFKRQNISKRKLKSYEKDAAQYLFSISRLRTKESILRYEAAILNEIKKYSPSALFEAMRELGSEIDGDGAAILFSPIVAPIALTMDVISMPFKITGNMREKRALKRALKPIAFIHKYK